MGNLYDHCHCTIWINQEGTLKSEVQMCTLLTFIHSIKFNQNI